MPTTGIRTTRFSKIAATQKYEGMMNRELQKMHGLGPIIHLFIHKGMAYVQSCEKELNNRGRTR
jgi:hypothetical protein